MNKKGFTFIEVIIIFTIIFIMTAVLLGTSYKDRSKKQIESVAREVSAAIRETQNNALTGKQKQNDVMPCAFAFKTYTNGYKMFYSYRSLDDSCPPDVIATDTTPSGEMAGFWESLVSTQLPKDVHINTIAVDYNENRSSNEDNIIFLVPYGDFIVTKRVGNSSDYKGIDVRVEKSDGSEKYHICVHATGLIEEIGFNNEDLACAF